MPVYMYQCDNCGTRFERLQKFSDPPITHCPECRKKSVRKLLQPAGIIFKGSGWYATDHRSPSGQGTSKKKDDSSGGEKSESKTSGDDKAA